MNVVVFGASGGTGRELVRQSLAKDFIVTAFVRNPAKSGIRQNRLEIVQGDVTNFEVVERAIAGQNAVLCALGSSTSFKRAPALVEGVSHIVKAMERKGVRRLIYLSMLGIGEGGEKQLSLLVRYVIAPLFLKKVAADHELKEKIIKQSNLDWTIVRPPRLTNGQHTGEYRHGENIKANSIIPASISRADLADFMIRQIADRTYMRKTPAVMY